MGYAGAGVPASPGFGYYTFNDRWSDIHVRNDRGLVDPLRPPKCRLDRDGVVRFIGRFTLFETGPALAIGSQLGFIGDDTLWPYRLDRGYVYQSDAAYTNHMTVSFNIDGVIKVHDRAGIVPEVDFDFAQAGYLRFDPDN